MFKGESTCEAFGVMDGSGLLGRSSVRHYLSGTSIFIRPL